MKRSSMYPIIIVIMTASASATLAAEQQPANAPEKQSEVSINQEVIEKNLASYRDDLKDLVTKAECRIRKIEATLKPEDYKKAAQKLIDKGDALIGEGKHDEAIKAWQDALGLSDDPAIKKAVEDRAIKLQEERDKKTAEAQAAEQERAAAEAAATAAAAAEAQAAQEKAMADKAAKEKEAAELDAKNKALDESWDKKKEKKAEPPKELGLSDILEKR